MSSEHKQQKEPEFNVKTILVTRDDCTLFLTRVPLRLRSHTQNTGRAQDSKVAAGIRKQQWWNTKLLLTGCWFPCSLCFTLHHTRNINKQFAIKTKRWISSFINSVCGEELLTAVLIKTNNHTLRKTSQRKKSKFVLQWKDAVLNHKIFPLLGWCPYNDISSAHSQATLT